MSRISSGPSFGSSSNNQSSRDSASAIYDMFRNTLEEERKSDDSSFANKIINSQAYKDAYALFVNLTDQRWLQRLLQIPYMYHDPGSSLLDNIGLSSGYNDKVAANYNAAMTEIYKLVEQYQSYVQGLPETQANQLSVIGSNAAVTGSNISGSQLEPMEHSAPQPMPSTDSSSFVLGAANFLLSATNGFADIALKFKDLGLRKTRQSFDIEKETIQFFQDLNKYARDKGISFSKPLRSFDDLTDDLQIMDSGKQAIQLKQFFQDAIDWEHYSPLVYKSIQEGRGNNFLSQFLYGFYRMNDDVFYGLGDLNLGPSVGVNGVVDAQYDLYMLEKGNAIMRKKYETDLLKYGVDSAEYKSLYDSYNKDIVEYEKRRSKITNDLIQSLHNSNHPDDKLLLSKILLDFNYNDLKIQDAQADWAGWNEFMNGVGNAASAVSGVAGASGVMSPMR